MQRRDVREPARRGHSGGSGDRSCAVGSGGDSSTDLKVSVPAGSVQSAKGEASDEDEETEYFDAMEDAPAFITVTADPKHHRYHPGLPGNGGRAGKSRFSCSSPSHGLTLWPCPPKLSQSLSRGPSWLGCSCIPGARLRMAPSCSEAGEEGQVSARAVGQLSPLPLS